METPMMTAAFSALRHHARSCLHPRLSAGPSASTRTSPSFPVGVPVPPLPVPMTSAASHGSSASQITSTLSIARDRMNSAEIYARRVEGDHPIDSSRQCLDG